MLSALRKPAYRAFVSHLICLRAAAGLSQRDLALRLGRPASYVAKTELGERRLDPGEFRAIVLALGGDPAQAFAQVCQALVGDEA